RSFVHGDEALTADPAEVGGVCGELGNPLLLLSALEGKRGVRVIAGYRTPRGGGLVSNVAMSSGRPSHASPKAKCRRTRPARVRRCATAMADPPAAEPLDRRPARGRESPHERDLVATLLLRRPPRSLEPPEGRLAGPAAGAAPRARAAGRR